MTRESRPFRSAGFRSCDLRCMRMATIVRGMIVRSTCVGRTSKGLSHSVWHAFEDACSLSLKLRTRSDATDLTTT